ncbi:glutaredoxin family protein [Leifsonia sp. H3M29-4]|uniref:glutaredoxin family protein n=1 Tax=Salinibacterium metalliresistens TaxID=3031321 RepID=UPI0023DB0154|nr:glutaredoxin family protein [Salinibacterium metalliresistens]MDF1477941.1 glutaredoxin family protein [Salinibacterium metalliresistens]
MSSTRLTLLSKPGCHLCDAAREVVTEVVAQLGDEASVTVEELSILDDPELNARYWDEIPVVLIDGVVHNIWRIDAERLRAALVANGQ